VSNKTDPEKHQLLSVVSMPVNNAKMDIANRLDEAMKRANIKSQRELSRRSGVGQSTISRILKGNISDSIRELPIYKLAKTCGVSVEWLIDGRIRPESDIRMTDREITLIKNFRKISATQREMLEISLSAYLTILPHKA
jgi:transcriptional regulator with XRE-family HTH domain